MREDEEFRAKAWLDFGEGRMSQPLAEHFGGSLDDVLFAVRGWLTQYGAFIRVEIRRTDAGGGENAPEAQDVAER